MSRFIKNPNLPESSVKSLICGGINEELTDYLRKRNIDLFFTEKNSFVDRAVSHHCDISALYIGNGKIIVDKQQDKLIDSLRYKGLTVFESRKEVKGDYPNDIILNHTLIGRYIIGKKSCFDPVLKENIESLEVIDTKQGYSKCSVLVVDENSIITDDASISKAANKFGINCLLISKGDISIEGHEYGFIGGASGKLSKNEVIFFGDITKHKDYEDIKKYLDARDIAIISFSFPLTDFGGIIPFEEL